MEIEILEKSENKLRFVISGISTEMVNAIRRIILSEVPAFAIDEVILLKNDSPLYDEIVAHRLGLIPLKTNLEKYNLPQYCESCGGYGCPLCQVSLTCEIVNDTNKPLVVYSGDLNSNDPEIVPVDDKIPIVKIDKDSSIIFEAYAVLGRAKDHVKWSAVSNASFRYYPLIEFDESKIKDKEEMELIVKLCPEKLFEIANNKLKLKEDYWQKCTLCKACENNSENKIHVSWEINKYIFTLESDGVLPFNDLIEKTFEIFLEKVNEFITKLEELEY
ncbi:MAG: DNA-directed RNA polymerase subunit D [Promethearchaeota archaeon]|nr:MAG: DNA-directed RNA polymerase subunit D [Candidatus Lokiarchaeota archaeon]